MIHCIAPFVLNLRAVKKGSRNRRWTCGVVPHAMLIIKNFLKTILLVNSYFIYILVSSHVFQGILTYLLTYPMEQRPSWEANSSSDSKDIPRNVWNPKVHYRVHTGPPPIPILSQLDPVHIPTHLYTCIYIYIHTVYIFIYILYIYLYTYCIYIYIHIVYIFIYIQIYIHTYI
jgi:hypothetical protein